MVCLLSQVVYNSKAAAELIFDSALLCHAYITNQIRRNLDVEGHRLSLIPDSNCKGRAGGADDWNSLVKAGESAVAAFMRGGDRGGRAFTDAVSDGKARSWGQAGALEGPRRAP